MNSDYNERCSTLYTSLPTIPLELITLINNLTESYNEDIEMFKNILFHLPYQSYVSKKLGLSVELAMNVYNDWENSEFYKVYFKKYEHDEIPHRIIPNIYIMMLFFATHSIPVSYHIYEGTIEFLEHDNSIQRCVTIFHNYLLHLGIKEEEIFVSRFSPTLIDYMNMSTSLDEDKTTWFFQIKCVFF